MLFYADKNVKENLFHMYKQDVMEQKNRKDEFVVQEKIKDKTLIQQVNRVHEDENNKKNVERLRKINENMYGFNQYWTKKDEERKNRFTQKPEININSYSVNIEPSNYNYSHSINQGKLNNLNINVEFESKKTDHINPILNPDYMGFRRIESLEKNQKMAVQKIYKNILDSQLNTKINPYDINNSFPRKNGSDIFKTNPCKYFIFIILLNIFIF